MEGNFKRLGNVLAHLTLPAFTLAFPALATVVRFTRAGVLETLQQATSSPISARWASRPA